MNVVSYHQRHAGGDFPRGPVAGTPWFQWRVPGLIPGQGTKSHMLHPSAAKYINILKKEGGGHKDLVSRSPTGPCTEVRPDLHTESHSRFQWKKESPGLLLQI